MQYPENSSLIKIDKQFTEYDFFEVLNQLKYTNNKDYFINISFDNYTKSNTDNTISFLNKFFACLDTNNSNKLRVCIDFQDKTFFKEEWIQIDKINTFLRSRNSELLFDEDGGLYTYYEAKNACHNFEKIAKSIPTNDLSPLEKLLSFYMYAIKLAYKNEEGFQRPHDARTFCGINNTDNIVCVGYSKLLENLCKYSSDNNLKCIKNFCKSNESYHCDNFVYIKDKKYNIEGIYELDASVDSYLQTLNFFMSTVKNTKSKKDVCVSSLLTESDSKYYSDEKMFEMFRDFLPNEQNKVLNKEHKEYMNYFINKTTHAYKEECQSILGRLIDTNEKNALLDKLKRKYVDFDRIIANADFKIKFEFYRNKLNNIAMNSPELSYNDITRALDVVVRTQYKTEDYNSKYYGILSQSIRLASNPDCVGYHNCFYKQHLLNQGVLDSLGINFTDDSKYNNQN